MGSQPPGIPPIKRGMGKKLGDNPLKKPFEIFFEKFSQNHFLFKSPE
jgi:hypothetical protein